MDINKIFQSEVHRKIVKFFHENQSSLDTPRGVATWVGEDRTMVKKALESLVAAKILIANRSTSTTGYSYTRDPKLISQIKKLLNKTA